MFMGHFMGFITLLAVIKAKKIIFISCPKYYAETQEVAHLDIVLEFRSKKHKKRPRPRL